MKKAIIGILVLCLLVCFQSVFADGTCGTNVKYTVSGDTIDFSRNDSAADAVWGTNCKTAVTGNSAVTKITVSEPIRVTNAVAMFRDLSNITEMDLSNLDVSRAADMYEMFKGCSSLRSLNVATWDTSIVTDMYEMFNGCSSLDSLDVSNWDTSKVVHMHGMFSGCGRLSSLDVSGWDTSAVIDMSDMFSRCTYLNPDVSGWDTSSVTDMSGMFFDCNYLINPNVSSWDTSNVTDMSQMFGGCDNLNNLDVRNWDTSNVTNMSGIFSDCHRNLTSLDLSGWNTSSVTNMAGMFSSCNNLSSLNVNGWDTSNVTDMSRMFYGCINLNNLDVSSWDTSNVSNMSSMFESCDSLSSLDASGWDTSNVTNMSGMFSDCGHLNSLDIGNWDTSNVIDMSDMFSACHNLSSLDLRNWDTSSLDNNNYMFANCGVASFTFGQNSLKNNFVYIMFSLFPRRDQRWYYIAAGPEASSPLSLGSFKENGELFNNYDPDTMAGTWATISSLSIMSPAGVDVTDQRVITSEETCQLMVSIDPAAAPQKAEWTSNRTSIAEVDLAGKVTFKAPGTVTITATAPNSGGIKAEMELTYAPTAPAILIRNADNEDVTGQTLRIIGDTIQLIGSAEPADGIFSAAWTVSDPDIAEVDVTGKLTFLTPGMVTAGYTVTAEDGTLQFAWVKLTNQPFAEEVKIKDADGNDISSQAITVRTKEYQLSASGLPADAAQKFIWTSSDTSIAVVDPTGIVTFKAEGNARITAEAEGSGVSAWVDFSFTTKEFVNILDPDGNDISGQTITLQTTEYQLNVSYWFPSGIVCGFEWISSNNDIAEVDFDYGLVVFKKPGTVQIKCSVVVDNEIDGEYWYPASVTLCYDPQIVTIQNSDGNDITGEWISVDTAEYQLNATASHSDSMPEFIWKSSNTDIAEVDQTGKVIFKKAGTVTITATSTDLGKAAATVKLTLLPAATAITIKNSSGAVITGKTITSNTLSYQLKASATPADAAQTVTWKSSDTAVAAVDKTGKVTFKKAGTVTITATSSDGSRKSATVKLKLLPEATAIAISNSGGTNITGKTVTSNTLSYQLKASATPADAAQTVTWKSSDTAVAAVDKTGKVTFKKAGTVTITATSTDRGKKTATVKLKLLPKATKIIIRDPEGNKVNGKTVKVTTKIFKLSASANPAKAEQTVTWKSSDTSIATVNKNGKVTFKKAGIVKIYATSTDRGKKKGVVKLKYAP